MTYCCGVSMVCIINILIFNRIIVENFIIFSNKGLFFEYYKVIILVGV